MFARIFLLFFLIFVFACAPTKKEVQIISQPPKKNLMPVSGIVPYAEIDKKIEELELLLKKPDLSEQQKAEINELINIYSDIKEISKKGKLDQNEASRLLELLFKSFNKIEERYVNAIQKKPVDIKEIMEKLAQKREKIIQDYKEGKYMNVVNQCLELKLKYGGYATGPDLETIFALSLEKIGMIREAIDSGEKALQQMAYIPQRELLKSKIEEWKKALAGTIVPEKEKVAKEKVDADLIIINAKRLIEQENFEQALVILNESGIKENEKIDQLRNRAIEGIINRDRNKAARLFLLAKESKDPEKKKEYLETARRILEALIVQYPESPLINRIKENMQKVLEELKALSLETKPAFK